MRLPGNAAGLSRSSLRIRGVLLPLSIAASLLLLAAGTPSPAHAAAGRYVALGDSYSAGVGAPPYVAGSGACLRSRRSYVYRLGRDVSSFRACAGATTSSVLVGQLGSFPTDTRLVTISIGGNDAGFVDVVQTCLFGARAACGSRVARAERFVRQTLPGRLRSGLRRDPPARAAGDGRRRRLPAAVRAAGVVREPRADRRRRAAPPQRGRQPARAHDRGRGAPPRRVSLRRRAHGLQRRRRLLALAAHQRRERLDRVRLPPQRSGLRDLRAGHQAAALDSASPEGRARERARVRVTSRRRSTCTERPCSGREQLRARLGIGPVRSGYIGRVLSQTLATGWDVALRAGAGRAPHAVELDEFLRVLRDEEDRLPPRERLDTKLTITRLRKLFYGGRGWDEHLIPGAAARRSAVPGHDRRPRPTRVRGAGAQRRGLRRPARAAGRRAARARASDGLPGGAHARRRGRRRRARARRTRRDQPSVAGRAAGAL